MQIARISHEDEIELQITASEAEVDAAFKDGLDLFVQQYRLQEVAGDSALEKITAALDSDSVQDAITSAVVGYLIPFAFNQEHLIPLSAARVGSSENPQPGTAFSFTVFVLPKPTFELSDYRPVEISLAPQDPVSEEDIDAQIQMLAQQYATVITDPETGEDRTHTPEVDDAWVAEHLADSEVGSVAELRERIRATSEEVKAEQHAAALFEAVMDQYASRLVGEVSQPMVDAVVADMLAAFEAQVNQEGMSLEEFIEKQQTSEEEIREALAKQAHTQITQGLVLDAVFRHEGLALDKHDLQAVLETMAHGNEEDAYRTLERTGRLFLFEEGASRMKAARWVVEHARVVE